MLMQEIPIMLVCFGIHAARALYLNKYTLVLNEVEFHLDISAMTIRANVEERARILQQTSHGKILIFLLSYFLRVAANKQTIIVAARTPRRAVNLEGSQILLQLNKYFQ